MKTEDTPPKALRVRQIARETLGLDRLGFRPTRSGRPGWQGSKDGEEVRIYLLFSKWNHGGSHDAFEFTVEFEVMGGRPIAGSRLFELLTDAEREEHRQLQNLVIAKLPIDDDVLTGLPPEWQADRLAQVAPRFSPYPRGADVWFKYLDEIDVRRWMDFIRDALPSTLSRLIASPAIA